MMNKQKGNMYGWVTHTWNPIKGKCPHDCSYCYMKRFPQGELRLDEKALNDNLGSDNVIFVGSSTDMWAEEVPTDWIWKVIQKCTEFPDNTYLFQTKNPVRFSMFEGRFPEKTILGTTIETNRRYTVSIAPPVTGRASWMMNNTKYSEYNYDKMVSIEPILDFDLDILSEWNKWLKPKFVSIGADSKNSGLPEPSKEKIEALIKELEKFTDVKIKPNLSRLLK